MLTEIVYVIPSGEVARRLRKQDLTAMPGSCDPRRPMDVQADVTVCSHGWLAGVQPHPHPHWPVGERPLSILGCGHRVGCSRECDKERIALGVDLNPAVALERIAQYPPMFSEQACVGVWLLVQQPSRRLDVGEEKGHRPAREFSHLGVLSHQDDLLRTTTPTTGFGRCRYWAENGAG